jgi:hypothetical protein
MNKFNSLAISDWVSPFSYLFKRLKACIRLDEVLILQGTPILGVLFSIDEFSLGNIIIFLLLCSGSIFLVAHIFLLNDWAGFNTDIQDPNRFSKITTQNIKRLAFSDTCPVDARNLRMAVFLSRFRNCCDECPLFTAFF